MLKLRYLFDNRPLAETLLENWDADPGSLDGFRISSNAIYWFRRNGALSFLRFAPLGEKRPDQVAAELAFLAHLQEQGYGAAVPIPTRAGNMLVTQQTPWGEQVASAFEAVPGMQLSRTDLSDAIVTAHGRALAELHQLSAAYRPEGPRRWSEADALGWMRATMADLPDGATAMEEADAIAAALAALPRTDETYGLVHYDFECDNVFFDARSDRCFAIDFDDAMYHWFAMDIEQAIASLADDATPADAAAREAAFLAGYVAVRPLPPELDRMRQLCRRFSSLYWYVRVRRSLDEVLPDPPDWMTGLRDRLAAGLAERAAKFGTELG